jgi:amino acid transporter
MYRLSKDKLIGKIWKEVDSKSQVPHYNILLAGLFLTVFVFLFDISVLSQLISMTTLLSYVLIMSIVVFKKIRKKSACLII